MNDKLNLPIGCKVVISIVRPTRSTPDLTVELEESQSEKVIELLKTFKNEVKDEYVYLVDYKHVEFATAPDIVKVKYPSSKTIYQVGKKDQLYGYWINVYPEDMNYTVTPNSKSDEVSIQIC